MRLMGLDYGSKTVGVAVSDPLGLTAQGVETVWRKQENKLRQTMARIEELISEYQVERIVLGYPKRTGLPVVMWDERLTTAEAERTLMETGVRRENRKQFLDQMAAVLILQGYLDRMNMNKDENNGEN